MGCCFSRNHEASEQQKQNPAPKLPETRISRLSPPISPRLEEETVKEVLSETPSQKRPSFTKLEEQKLSSTILPSFPKSEVSEEEEEEKKIEKQQVPYYMTTPTTTQEVSVSEVSEICSLSESYSTLTKEDVEEGEVRQQLRIERPPSKIPQRRRSSNNRNPINDYQNGISGIDYHQNRERRSPVRRSSEQPSPNRRNDNNNNGIKFGSNNTDMGQTGRRQRISTTNGNNNNRSWRDPGESSGRRSRSPSITRNNNNEVMGQNKSGMGRSPSARKAGRSPARIPPMASENSSKSETSKEDVEGNGISAKKEVTVNFLTDPLEGRSTFRPADVLIYGWTNGKHACVDLTGVSPLVGRGKGTFTVGHAALRAASGKIAKHEKACLDNGHAFILFAFDTFGFLAPEAVGLLKRVQKVMHSNVMTPGSKEFVFKRIGFAIQKELAAQLVARLPSTPM